ncbi:MAG: RagB/SusD family nutrient uptake outer membrane protein [Balneolales bacterium]
MKNLHYKTIALLFSILVFNACDTSVLNVSPQDQMSDDSVWEDEALSQLFLNDMYIGMRHGLYEIQLSSLTDDSQFIHGYGTNEVVEGIVTPSNLGSWTHWNFEQYNWSNVYSRIRQVNIMLENIDDAVISSEELRDQMKGEAHFLRAFFYHNLLRVYGGVPIIEQSYGLDDDLLVSRNTFAETVDFIVQETDLAAELLNLEARELGRATQGAAMALKSRILLHAASDLYNDSPANELVGYTSGSQQDRWQAAQTAAKDIMDLNKYSLYRQHADATENYTQLFLTNDDHEEIIMSRYFLSDKGDGENPAQHNGPNGYRGWAGNTPVQSIVDAYEMEDGSEFDWGNPEHAAAPYENRDPRFYASILYDGAPWVEPPSVRVPHDPVGIIQTFEHVTLPNGDEVPGIDTRNGSIEDWNGSYSGYYLRKFIDNSIENFQDEKQTVPWRFFRYAEILFNYAEASMELNQEGEARDVINQIRDRAGMPDITESGQALKDRYRNERRIELFAETHRFFDIRRWKTAPNHYHDAQGIKITADADDPTDRSTYSNYEYTPMTIQSRGWDDSQYFVPIPNDEMNRNDQLEQNPNYPN